MTVILVVSLQKSATLNALLSGDAFQGSKLVFATRPTYSEIEIGLSAQQPGPHVPMIRDISLAQINDVPLWSGWMVSGEQHGVSNSHFEKIQYHYTVKAENGLRPIHIG